MLPLENSESKAVIRKRSRGALTVEYMLCMVIGVGLMLGVFELFEKFSMELIEHFIEHVQSFPDNL